MKYNFKGIVFFSALLTNVILTIKTQAQNTVQLTVRENEQPVTISKYIYGHFSEDLGRCIYDGFWADSSIPVKKQDRIRLDVVEALKKIKIPVLRWPGGCFADQYHWRDGIGPRQQRTKTVNTTWGMVTDDNSFGTHEFLELCSLLGCEPYIAGNVGTGTPKEMEDWLEYLNYNGTSSLTELRKKNGREKPWNVSFWGIGNESWGCGGSMTPEYYSNEYKRYSEFAKSYPGAPLKLIASGANSDDYNWTDVVMKNTGLWNAWGISMHYYTVVGDWGHKGSATHFDEKEYFAALKKCLHIEELINRHSAIMDVYDPQKKKALVVDEWGIWTDVEPGTNPAFLYQQNSLRDALIAATSLNIFNNHCARVKMANLAQTVNVLQSLILTDKDKMVLTPTYYVFDLYKVHQDAIWLPLQFSGPDYAFENEKIPAINASASKDGSGAVHISIVNLDPSKTITIKTAFPGMSFKSVSAQILTSEKFTDVNTFDKPMSVKTTAFNGAKKQADNLIVEMPPQSVVVVELK
ncbi:MAG TPA: alpha-L-arabinofuranosidase C-terminal domain-containing protein [Puia sp.]|nr:alpha-L-arabinofuranosidase C-terminal domain-containing protein [Puia sp.]